MEVLIDEDLSPRIASALRDVRCGAIAVRDPEFPSVEGGSPDQHVVAYCFHNMMVLVTENDPAKDQELREELRRKQVSAILVRPASSSPRQLLTALLVCWDQIEDRCDALPQNERAIFDLDPHKMRVTERGAPL